MYSKIIAVTNRHLACRPYFEQIGRICRMHPRALILREKDLPEKEYLDLARDVLEICERYGVPMIPHYYPSAADLTGTGRVHLPLWKLEALRAGAQDFRGEAGCSVHSLEEAVRAEELGAVYLTAGHIFETDCKRRTAGRGLAFLKEVCGAVKIPVYAIGGIQPDPEQIAAICACGAAGACIMSGMMKL